MGWTTGLRFLRGTGKGLFLLITTSRSAPGFTHFQWVPRPLSPEVKRLGRESGHTPPSGAQVKNAWNYTSTPPYVFMTRCSVQCRDNFYLLLYPPPPHFWKQETRGTAEVLSACRREGHVHNAHCDVTCVGFVSRRVTKKKLFGSD
jgi:hypothetical protein